MSSDLAHGHPRRHRTRAAALYHCSHLLQVANKVSFIAATALVLLRPVRLDYLHVVLLLLFAVIHVANRSLNRASWRLGASATGTDHGDVFIAASTPIAWITWRAVDLSAWSVGGAIVVTLRGPGGLALSAGVLLTLGLYFTVGTATYVLVRRPSYSHWTQHPALFPAYGIVWIPTALVASPSLASRWSGWLLFSCCVACFVAVIAVLTRCRHIQITFSDDPEHRREAPAA